MANKESSGEGRFNRTSARMNMPAVELTTLANGETHEANKASETVTVRLTLNVMYSLNGENATEMVSRLRKMCERAIGEGMLTGETDAEVEEYSMDAVIQPEPMSEDELASFMLQRIDNGSLALEDIPVRLARYGLMDPNAFVDEMRERMELAKADK